MTKDKAEYIKIKNSLQKSLEKLFNEKEEEKEDLSLNTRFEIKNKLWADEILNKIDLRWREDYYRLRKKWSYYIFASLAWTILFQFFLAWFLIFGVTHGLFTFSSVYSLFFLMVWENFTQIIWLSYIIVRFLFSEK